MPAGASLRYRSHAKINWYLDVLQRRPDGFTDIETIFQSVSLHDELHFSPAKKLNFTCNDLELDNSDNLVCRAARLLQEATGCTLGARIHLEKRIPVAAGLAGGSGNCAAALIALNRLWELGLDRDRLHGLGAELGSDVPFCLEGGLMAATGRGEILESLPPLKTQWLVLVHPPLEIKAGDVYNHPSLARSRETAEDGKTPGFRDAIAHIRGGQPAGATFNRMESAVFIEYPRLKEIPPKLLDLGATAAIMSGSGPVFFGLAPSELAAHRIAKGFSRFPVHVVHTVDRGVSEI